MIVMSEENPVYNGRINIMNNTNTPYEHDEYDNTSYKEALLGDKMDTVLSTAFFSKENIEIIQNGIRVGVYNKSGGKYIINKQDVTNIKIIMRGIFLDHARYVPNQITEEIKYLNKVVLDECVHKIFSEVIAYLKYKKDVSTLPEPIGRPQVDPNKDHKQLELTKPYHQL